MTQQIIIDQGDVADPGKVQDNITVDNADGVDRVSVGDKQEDDNKPTKPENVPDKFWNAETGQVDYDAWSKSYRELEKKFSQKDQPKPKQDASTTDADAARKTVEDAGLNFDTFTQEYTENGELSEASFEALEKAGIPRPVVEQFIAGQEAIRDSTVNAIFDSVGGKSVYGDMVEWAKTNLTKEQIAAYNAQLGGGTEAAQLAVAGLHSQYVKATGKAPNLITGDVRGPDVSGFESMEQITEAVRDPRYKKDPAYRREVERKLQASSFLNVQNL